MSEQKTPKCLEPTCWIANSNVVVASYRKCPWEFPSEAKTPWREGKCLQGHQLDRLVAALNLLTTAKKHPSCSSYSTKKEKKEKKDSIEKLCWWVVTKTKSKQTLLTHKQTLQPAGMRGSQQP